MHDAAIETGRRGGDEEARLRQVVNAPPRVVLHLQPHPSFFHRANESELSLAGTVIRLKKANFVLNNAARAKELSTAR